MKKFGKNLKLLLEKKRIFINDIVKPPEHHRGKNGPHMNYKKNLEYKQLAQRYYEEHIGSRAEFMAEFGKNYL